MITQKIKALFKFIEYLHSNIDNFNRNNDLIEELELLKKERKKVSSKNTFKEKLKYDEVQAQIDTKLEILECNTSNLIKAKAKELTVCNFENEPNYSFNGIEAEIQQLKENFSNDDLPEIFKSKQQYIEYRKSTHETFLSLGLFINELDEITKSLFNYFNDTEQNEFEAFETKTIQVNDINEAVKLFQQGHTKFTLPNDFLSHSKDKPNQNINPVYDTRFWLTTFFEKQEQTKHQYKSIQRQIENNGYFIVNVDADTVKVYTPELVVIFTTKELQAQNMDTQTETTINGWEYLNTYVEAYKEGEQYFENEFKVSPNTLYGANAEQYVRDIHLNFFHVKHTGNKEGWGFVKNNYPFILTHKEIKVYGYYSGIVSKVEEQINKYPVQFATFDKCEHNSQPQPISVNESRTKKIILKTINNLDKQGWQYAFVSEQDYDLFTDLLTNFFEYQPYTLPKTIIQLKRTCKTKVAKALGEIHKELSNENKLSTDNDYFKLIRVLNHFEKETEVDLYKALTR
jgi:hypothetical protein